MKLGRVTGWVKNRRSLPFLVLLLSLAVTVLAWVWAGQSVGNEDRERFMFATEETELAIKDRVSAQVDLLNASSAYYRVQGGWTHEQFHKYIQSLTTGPNGRDTQSIGFIRRIPAMQPSSLPARARGISANKATLNAVLDRQDLYPVVYIEPPTPLNLSSIGFNAYSDPIRREAMAAACDSALPRITALVSVPTQKPAHVMKGFVLFCPIYESGIVPISVSERRRHLLGFVYSRFRGSDIFRGVLEGEARRDLNIEIFDAESGSEPVRFYSSSPKAVRRKAHIVFDGSIAVQGRQWLVRYHSSSEFEQQSAFWLVNWIPVVGSALGIILFSVSFGQVRAYRQLNEQAEVLARSESHQRLLANAGSLLVDCGINEEAFRELGVLMVQTFSDWFAIIPAVDEPDRPWFVSVGNATLKSIPMLIIEDKAFLNWVADHAIPMRYDLSRDYDPRLKFLREFGFHGICLIPLSDSLGMLGTLISGRQIRDYQKEEVTLLVQIASGVSVAITSRRLRTEKDKELEERKRAEEAAKRINENLEQLVEERTTELLATNKELEAFCYSVSHDLRAPLRSVDGFSKSLLEDYGNRLDDQAKDYISRVRNASHRMDELISSLLNLSRITRLEISRQKVDVTRMAMNAVEESLESANGKTFTIKIQPNMSVEADSKLIRVVFDNLIRNAFKFTSPIEEPSIEVGSDGNIFFVKDNGVGFNPAYSEKLFQAFERLHSQHEFPGSGIGLATVQRIILRHGGTIWAESSEGKGATFYFTLR